MVKALITMLDNGEFSFHYVPGKDPIAKEGFQKVVTLPEPTAKRIQAVENAHQDVQEELYEAFYATED